MTRLMSKEEMKITSMAVATFLVSIIAFLLSMFAFAGGIMEFTHMRVFMLLITIVLFLCEVGYCWIERFEKRKAVALKLMEPPRNRIHSRWIHDDGITTDRLA